MFYMFKAITEKFIYIILSLYGIKCSIDGTFSGSHLNVPKPKPADECNPLYWYPKHIPEYCNYKKGPAPTDPEPEIPFPIPVPAPLPILPPPPPIVPPRPLPPVPVPPVVVPQPVMPLPIPLPYCIPLAPTNPMVPVAGIPLAPQRVFPVQPYPPYPPSYPPPYPPPQPPPYGLPYPPPIAAPLPSPYASLYPSYPMPRPGRIGMVPGIPGLVSPDGGINIMPFSDAYSDMLENHKQKMLRRRLQKFLNDYERPPWKNRRKPKPRPRPKGPWQTNDIE